MQPKIPDKRFFRIGEVSRILGVPPHVLRYWEQEFSTIRPLRTPSRHRLYRRRDLFELIKIKKLLYQEKYRIAGARSKLRKSTSTAADPSPLDLEEIRAELVALRRLLD